MSDEINRIGTTTRWSDIVVHAGTVYVVEVPTTIDGDITVQAREVLASLEDSLRQAGSSKARLLMVTIYLGFHANRMDPRPEDRKDADIADGAGELGFFPPYSWWPLWTASSLGLCVFGVASAAWWLFIIGVVLGAMALVGWIFELQVIAATGGAT